MADRFGLDEEFVFAAAETAADQECDGPGFCVDEEIVNDAEVLFRIVNFVARDSRGAAEMRIARCRSGVARAEAQFVLAANGQETRGQWEGLGFGFADVYMQNIFTAIDLADGGGVQENRFLKAGWVLGTNNFPH